MEFGVSVLWLTCFTWKSYVLHNTTRLDWHGSQRHSGLRATELINAADASSGMAYNLV